MQYQQNEQLYHRLRETFPRFVYEAFEYVLHDHQLSLEVRFILEHPDEDRSVPLTARSTYVFPDDIAMQFDKPALDSMVFHIGMAELVSYWKLACPKTVEIQPYQLTDAQLAWWKDLYYWGQQEFFFVNGIPAPDQEDFMQLRSAGSEYPARFSFSANADRNLVPIGGGKDSAVTLNAMTQLSNDNYTLIINPRGASLKTHEIAGLPDDRLVVIKRSIDKTLLELNANGFADDLPALNGHTPFSATLAYYSLVASYFTGAQNIVLSNESSANEPTFIGTKINHQYSKSFEFEQNFRAYVKEYISTDFNYYSFLRPLNELQIAKLFAEQPAYFNDFKSCNVGSKQNIWCCHCAKCMFTYIILSPFIEPAKLAAIFGEDLFAKPALQKEFDELTGVAEVKPFECVGTVDEVNAALSMCIDTYYKNAELPYLLQYFKQGTLYQPGMKAGLEHLQDLEPQHNLTDQQVQFLKGRLGISQAASKSASN